MSSWPAERPAPTVVTTRRSGGGLIIGRQLPRGSGRNVGGRAGALDGDAVRVSIAEAGVLQTFPADYPWQGNTISRATQVGNAIPPVLAAAVLGAVGA